VKGLTEWALKKLITKRRDQLDDVKTAPVLPGRPMGWF